MSHSCPREGSTPFQLKAPNRRILFLNMFGEPSTAASAQYLADLSRYLADEGWLVEVLCSNRLYEDPAAKLPAREKIGRVTVRRLPVRLHGRSGLLRFLGYVEFLVRVMLHVLFTRRPAVCVSMTTPPFLLLAGAVLRLRGARHLHWCLDIYPEIAHALGVLGGAAASLLVAARRILWHVTDVVVTLGPFMAGTVAKTSLSRRKTRVIPLWAEDGGPPVEAAGPLETPSRFTLLYSGNIGAAHDVETALSAAHRLPEVDFVFAGDGAKRPLVEKAARDTPNVRLQSLSSREHLAARLRSASAHLVTLDPRADGLLVPSKLYAAMASGRPVIVVASDRNELALELERGGFGVRIEPGDVDAFVSAVKRLARDRALADEAGRRAKAAFLERHRGSVCMQRFHHILRGLSVGVSGGGGH